MGRLYIPGKNGDAFFSLAVGKISVPADLPLILRVRQDADNISPLKRLEVRALYGLSIANTELTDEHRAQVQNYLTATELKLGLLVNLGHYPKAEVERIVAEKGRYAH